MSSFNIVLVDNENDYSETINELKLIAPGKGFVAFLIMDKHAALCTNIWHQEPT